MGPGQHPRYTDARKAVGSPKAPQDSNTYRQEQGRHALNFQQAGFERAAQEYEQAARAEVHVAVAQATEMSGAEMRESVVAVENQAEQTWTSQQVMILSR